MTKWLSTADFLIKRSDSPFLYMNNLAHKFNWKFNLLNKSLAYFLMEVAQLPKRFKRLSYLSSFVFLLLFSSLSSLFFLEQTLPMCFFPPFSGCHHCVYMVLIPFSSFPPYSSLVSAFMNFSFSTLASNRFGNSCQKKRSGLRRVNPLEIVSSTFKVCQTSQYNRQYFN